MASSTLDQAVLQQALILLAQIRHLPGDEAYLKRLGVYPVFQNGQQAWQVIQQKGIQVVFGDMGNSPAHAQWVAEQNQIMLNQRYRGDTSPATLYALSEALYHEAGHAAGNGDDQSSIQEELNCLALNTLAHRFHRAINPYYGQTVSHSPLLADGVALYANLFFDPDPAKRALIQRVIQKYGDLPLESPGHPTPGSSTFQQTPSSILSANTALAHQIQNGYWLRQQPFGMTFGARALQPSTFQASLTP